MFRNKFLIFVFIGVIEMVFCINSFSFKNSL